MHHPHTKPDVDTVFATDRFGDTDDPRRSAISRLIDHLIGGAPRMQGDAGLARFSDQRLLAIEQGAQDQAQDCLSALQSVAHVLAIAASHPQVAMHAHVVFNLAEHLHNLSQALERWNDLADNSHYLRIHRHVADDLARRYASWCASTGEWPSLD